MSRTRSQQRDYEVRRAHKRDVREVRRLARRRRRITITIVAAALLIVALVIALLVLNRPASDLPPPRATSGVPSPDLAEGRNWQATLTTSEGDIELELFGAEAPQATSNFIQLARDGFFDATQCHRLLPDSLLQCGDPTATGTGGPGYSFGPIENAPSTDMYPAGTLAMARRGGDAESMGSQFFLVFADVQLPADEAGGYSVFGRITSGLDILERVGAEGTVEGGSQPLLPVTIEGVTVS